MILHIPHSSTVIPLNTGFTVSGQELDAELLLLTDWYTDDLFSQGHTVNIIAPFSRLFCDVERFPDDDAEVMSKAGMGALYTKRDDGSPLRIVTPELRSRIIREYYLPHHEKLTQAVEDMLTRFGKAMILDCHSFPDIPLKRDLSQDPRRPEFALGTDPFHTPDSLFKESIGFFLKRRRSFGLDFPYSGTIVPMKYYRKDKRVQSIMLEVNRKLYLKPGSSCRSLNYSIVKETIAEFINEISRLFLAMT